MSSRTRPHTVPSLDSTASTQEPEFSQRHVTAHFDALAADYDAIKARHPYYYNSILRALFPYALHRLAIIDVGCATGTLLALISPRLGYGYDPSAPMIAVAKKKYANISSLRFSTRFPKKQDFDTALLIDVVEHVPDLPFTLQQIFHALRPQGTLILSHVEATYEPVLAILERFRLKMDEGPHQRINNQSLISLCTQAGFSLKRRVACWPLPAVCTPLLPLLDRLLPGPIQLLTFEKSP